MDKVELRVPAYGMADTESVVLAWLREPGEHVREGDPLVEIDTAKAQETLDSPATGFLGPRLVEVDGEVTSGTVLTWVEKDDG